MRTTYGARRPSVPGSLALAALFTAAPAGFQAPAELTPTQRREINAAVYNSEHRAGDILRLLGLTSGAVELPPAAGISHPFVPPAPQDAIGFLLCLSSTVIVGTATDVTVAPTSDNGYLFTSVDLQVSEVIKAPPDLREAWRMSTEGARPVATVLRLGGTTTLDGRLVRAPERPGFPTLRGSTRYLMFLTGPLASTGAFKDDIATFVLEGRTAADVEAATYRHVQELAPDRLLTVTRAEQQRLAGAGCGGW
ncbi:MAG: hypothetical protein R2752_04215 [Vicinamibacterales bacterium]